MIRKPSGILPASGWSGGLRRLHSLSTCAGLFPQGLHNQSHAGAQILVWRSMIRRPASRSKIRDSNLRCLWLNDDKTFPWPNRRDTIRHGWELMEVWPQAKTFLAPFIFYKRLQAGRFFFLFTKYAWQICNHVLYCNHKVNHTQMHRYQAMHFRF